MTNLTFENVGKISRLSLTENLENLEIKGSTPRQVTFLDIYGDKGLKFLDNFSQVSQISIFGTIENFSSQASRFFSDDVILELKDRTQTLKVSNFTKYDLESDPYQLGFDYNLIDYLTAGKVVDKNNEIIFEEEKDDDGNYIVENTYVNLDKHGISKDDIFIKNILEQQLKSLDGNSVDLSYNEKGGIFNIDDLSKARIENLTLNNAEAVKVFLNVDDEGNPANGNDALVDNITLDGSENAKYKAAQKQIDYLTEAGFIDDENEIFSKPYEDVIGELKNCSDCDQDYNGRYYFDIVKRGIDGFELKDARWFFDNRRNNIKILGMDIDFLGDQYAELYWYSEIIFERCNLIVEKDNSDENVIYLDLKDNLHVNYLKNLLQKFKKGSDKLQTADGDFVDPSGKTLIIKNGYLN